MRYIYLVLVLLSISLTAKSQADKVSIVKNSSGMKLAINGEDFMINGMNWDYFPIGANFSYSLWNQPDDLIKSALDSEMTLLKNMGVNSIRVYTGIQAKWIQYIYENYGIYTMLNHSFGRYGVMLDSTWVANTEYEDPRVKAILINEVSEMANNYKGTPGLLLYLIGNENNYGLSWEGAETEDIPVEDINSKVRATAMYKLFNEATLAIKALDGSHPVAICNGDLLHLEIIKEECKDIDILGINIYRGASFGDAFQRVKDEMNKPIMLTEFGADAYDDIIKAENQQFQANIMLNNWQEIYQNAAGLGMAGNSIGGFTFQFSDGWWKFGQTTNLDMHDTNASWSNGGYSFDFKEGENNMNEEWFGICAKGPTNANGLYTLHPRAAYYVLKEAHQFDPYDDGATIKKVANYFANIKLADAINKAEPNSQSKSKALK